MSWRTLSALLFPLACVACGTPSLRIVTPPAPPAWVMQDCAPWPTLAGEGRVTLPQLAQGVAEAKTAHADCEARLQGLQHYVREIVLTEGD